MHRTRATGKAEHSLKKDTKRHSPRHSRHKALCQQLIHRRMHRIREQRQGRSPRGSWHCAHGGKTFLLDVRTVLYTARPLAFRIRSSQAFEMAAYGHVLKDFPQSYPQAVLPWLLDMKTVDNLPIKAWEKHCTKNNLNPQSHGWRGLWRCATKLFTSTSTQRVDNPTGPQPPRKTG